MAKRTIKQIKDERRASSYDFSAVYKSGKSQFQLRRERARDTMDRVIELRRSARDLEGSQGKAAQKLAQAKVDKKGFNEKIDADYKRANALAKRYIAQRARGVGR